MRGRSTSQSMNLPEFTQHHVFWEDVCNLICLLNQPSSCIWWLAWNTTKSNKPHIKSIKNAYLYFCSKVYLVIFPLMLRRQLLHNRQHTKQNSFEAINKDTCI